MRKPFILMLLACSLAQAQDFEKNTTISSIVSPGSWDDGFGMGIQLEHQNRTIYVGAETYFAPELNANKSTPPLGYYHLIGRFGFNHFWGGDPDRYVLRLFAGGRGGVILRETHGANYALLGGEIGFDIRLYRDIYFRFSGAIDAKTDSAIWSNSPSHNVKSVLGGLGIRF